MSQKIEILKAERREKLGSRAARALRAAQRIPAILGADPGHEHVDLSISAEEFTSSRRRHAHVYEIALGATRQMAVVRELHWDTFGEHIVHVEFKRVQKDVKTDSQVELEFTGHPKGGVLNHLITHVTVRCVPALIPDSIEVPVGALEIGGSILGSELVAPEGVELLIAPDARVALVMAATKLEVAAPATPEAPAAEGATPAAPPTPAT